MYKNKTAVIAVLALVIVCATVYTISAPENDVISTIDQGTAEETMSADTNGLNFGIDTTLEKYSNKSEKHIGWGFKKIKNSPPEIDKKTIDMFKATNTYYLGSDNEKVLYLTFDEGYENGYTSKILDVLKEKNVKAAFFITGPYLERETELVDRMVNEGHTVGNHTVHHPNLAKSDLNTVVSELKGLNDKFKEKYSADMVYMRPPEGEYSEKLLSFTHDMGYKTILWSFAYRDWDVNTQKGGDYAFQEVTPYLHNGAVLLLHAVSSDNASCLGNIIDYAQSQGYRFETLDHLTSTLN